MADTTEPKDPKDKPEDKEIYCPICKKVTKFIQGSTCSECNYTVPHQSYYKKPTIESQAFLFWLRFFKIYQIVIQYQNNMHKYNPQKIERKWSAFALRNRASARQSKNEI